MKNKSIAQTKNAKREIAALKALPDSSVDVSEIPPQSPTDPKWEKAVVGRFYRPVKAAVSLRVDADVLAWFKERGEGYQSRMNEVLRREMIQDQKGVSLSAKGAR